MTLLIWALILVFWVTFGGVGLILTCAAADHRYPSLGLLVFSCILGPASFLFGIGIFTIVMKASRR